MLTLALVFLTAGPDNTPHVVLGLDTYRDLLTQQSAESFTIVEAAKVEGSFKRGLTLTLRGRARGDLRQVPVLEDSVPLTACESRGAVLARQSGAYVAVWPQAASFEVRCAVGKAGTPLSLKFLNVLAVDASVTDGVVELGAPRAAEQTLTVAAPGSAAAPVAAPAAPRLTGRYQLTVGPDETRFIWRMAVQNPSEAPATVTLPVREGETPESTTPKATRTTGALEFEVGPGSSELVVSGVVAGTRFSPPLPGDDQPVLIEGQALVRLELRGHARRISPKDTGLTPTSAGAMAVALSGDEAVEWSVQHLEALPSTSYSVGAVSGAYYLAADGKVLGESEVLLHNQGAAALELTLSQRPSWAAIDGQPTILSRTPAGTLWFPIQIESTRVAVQHEQSLDVVPGFAFGALEVPGVGTSASVVRLGISSARDWVPLYESFASEHQDAWPALEAWLTLLGLAAWAFGLLREWLGGKPALVLGTGLAAVTQAHTTGHWAILTALGLATALRVVPWLQRRRVPLFMPVSLVGLAARVAVVTVMLLFLVTLLGDNVRSLFGMSADALAGETDVTPRAGRRPVAGEYRGTPAHTDMPPGTHQRWFNQELVDLRQPAFCRVVLMRAWLVDSTIAMLHLAVLAFAFRHRKALVAGVSGHLERLLDRMAPVEGS